MFKKALSFIKSKLKPKNDLSAIDFSDYFAAMDGLSKKIPIDSFLIQNSKPITIEIKNNTLRAIRIELPTDEPLNLQSIELFEKEGVKLSADKLPQVWLSSYYGATGDRIKNNEVFDSNSGYEWTIHTKPYTKSWALLIFKKPTRLHSLTIRNRKLQAERARGMKIFIANEPDSWELVYKVSTMKKFHNISKEISGKFRLDKVAYGLEFHKFTEFIIKKQYIQAESTLGILPDDIKDIIINRTNTYFLSPKSLEWGSHGVKKVFKFWTLEEKKRYILFSNTIIDCLNDLTGSVSFGFGSVLGIVRDNDMIPHDDDMDIIVGFPKKIAPTITKARQLVRKHLEKNGFTVGGNHFNHWYVYNEEFKVDVFSGIFEADETVGWYPGPRHVTKIKDVFPAKKVSFHGILCPIPCNPEKYLEDVYGDWKSPDPGHRHVWDKKDYLDIG